MLENSSFRRRRHVNCSQCYFFMLYIVQIVKLALLEEATIGECDRLCSSSKQNREWEKDGSVRTQSDYTNWMVDIKVARLISWQGKLGQNSIKLNTLYTASIRQCFIQYNTFLILTLREAVWKKIQFAKYERCICGRCNFHTDLICIYIYVCIKYENVYMYISYKLTLIYLI